MRKTFNIVELIIGKYFKRLSKSDQAGLNTWLESNHENESFLKEVLDENALKEASKNYKKDVSHRWEMVKSKIEKKQKVRRLKEVLRYAAIFIIPISILAVFYSQQAGSDTNVAVHEITPGSSKAVLTLSDGSVVDLNEQNVSNLKEYDGTTISKNNNELFYKQSDKSSKDFVERFNTVYVPRGGEYHLVLADGTKVWLNSETSLRYPVQFVKDQRVVELTGEAYFEVAKDASKPFIVAFENEKVEVLGTSFNIKCYKDESTYQTTLVEGKVKYQNAENELILLPEKQAEFSKETKKVILKAVNSEDYIAWVRGRFIFKNQRLEEILTTLSRWYDVSVVFDSEKLKDIRFTGKLKKYDEIEKILEILEATKKVDIEASSKILTIKSV